MSDPLSDPRAARLLAADPGEVGLLASGFHTVATQAETSAAGLRGAKGDETWTGPAAEAFRLKLGKLPHDLDNVQRSYGDVASALNTYEAQLGPIHNQFQSIATQLQDARSRLAGAQGQLTSAQGSLSTAAGAPGATSSTAAVVSAQSAVHAASGAVGNLQREVSGLEGRGLQLLDEFDGIRGHARSAVSHAAGIAPSESWLSGALHDVGNFLEGAAVGIGKSAWALISGKAIADFIEHPSWKTFGELAKDVAVVASLVAMVAAPFAAPEVLGADAALAGGDGLAEGGLLGAQGAAAAGDSASTLGTVARGVSTWGGRASTAGIGAGALADGAQGHWGAVGIDAAFAIAPNLGSVPGSLDAVRGPGDTIVNVFGKGDQAVADTRATSAGMRDFQLLSGDGLNPAAAASLSFRDGQLPNVLRGVDPADPAAVHQASVQASQAANRAAGTALHVGKPAAGLFDKLVTDPTQEKLKGRVTPEPLCGG